ncbi:unnamed protein product [Lota lota]
MSPTKTWLLKGSSERALSCTLRFGQSPAPTLISGPRAQLFGPGGGRGHGLAKGALSPRRGGLTAESGHLVKDVGSGSGSG